MTTRAIPDSASDALIGALRRHTLDVSEHEPRRRIVIAGSGYVSRATQQLLLDIGIDADAVTVFDAADGRLDGAPMVAAGAKTITLHLTAAEYDTQLASLLDPGDLLINLTYDVCTEDVLTWCGRNDVLSIDTSVELWDPYDGWADDHPPATRTLAWRHRQMQRTLSDRLVTAGDGLPTMLVEHGANPGWVSHATRAAIRALADGDATDAAARAHAAIAAGDYARAAYALGVRIITIAERDTQTSTLTRKPGEFVNTWSIDGFRSEGGAPAAAWLGSHDHLPDGWQLALPNTYPSTMGPVYGPRAGMETHVRTFVPPFGTQLGMPIDHGEINSIGRSLTMRAPTESGWYSPTVFYAYLPCDDAIASINDLRGRSYELDRGAMRIMTDDIDDGRDALGVLVMTRRGAVWHGSQLDIHETRDLVGAGHNATTLQVAASVVAGAGWVVANPRRGVVVPDDIAEHADVLAAASRWLGPMPTVRVDWTPADGPITPSAAPPRDGDALRLAAFVI